MRHGAYHYPARLLLKVIKDERPIWKLRWWRHCNFISPSPPSESVAPESDIVDELWKETDRRRAIRVSTAIWKVLTDNILPFLSSGSGYIPHNFQIVRIFCLTQILFLSPERLTASCLHTRRLLLPWFPMGRQFLMYLSLVLSAMVVSRECFQKR